MSDRFGRAGVLARNSFANLVRVASTSLVALLLPVVLVGALRPDLYATWALLFGLAGFVLYLDFGLPASVQTLVSRAVVDERPGEARARAMEGIGWATGIAAIMLLALSAAGAASTMLFPALAERDSLVLTTVVVLVGIGNVATFIGNTASAYFAGIQRSEVAAATLVPGRVASLCLAVPAAVVTQDLVLVALAYAAPLVAGASIMVLQVARVPRIAVQQHARALVLRYSGPLAAWSVYMLCISGVGILVVGRVDFRAVAIFSLATAFSSALTGVQSALVSPVLSELGRAHAMGDRARFTDLVLTATRLNVGLVVLGVVGVEAVYLVAAPYLGGAQSVPVPEAATIVACTVIAAGLRLTMSPLTFAFVASGSHRKLLLPPLFEALATLVATIGLGVLLGGAGVALGLVVGAAAGVAIALLWSHRIVGVVDAPARRIALAGVVRPAAALLPAQVAFTALITAADAAPALTMSTAILMLLASAACVWGLCTPPAVRRHVIRKLGGRAPRNAVPAVRS